MRFLIELCKVIWWIVSFLFSHLGIIAIIFLVLVGIGGVAQIKDKDYKAFVTGLVSIGLAVVIFIKML